MAAPFPSPTKTWHDNSYPSILPTRPELSVKGKSVLVTGGGTGIGAETAKSFAIAGASRIALLGRREQPLLDTKAAIEAEFPDTKVSTYPTDISKTEDVEAAFASFVGDGKLDILIAAAYKAGPLDFITTVDTEVFMEVVDVNLRGSVAVAKAFLRHADPHAVVVDVNSSGAHVNFGPAFTCYSVCKLGTFKIWNGIATQYPDYAVFSIQPGVVDTDMNKEAGGVKAMGFEDHVSLPAQFMVWLASPEARFLSGKFLWSNWDVDELKAQKEEIVRTRKFNFEMVGWPFGSQDYAGTWNSDKV